MIRNWLKTLCLASYMFSILSFANMQPGSHHYSFLAHGLNLNNYQLCLAKIQDCPLDQQFRNEKCVNRVLKSHHFCNQLRQLAHAINVSASQLSIRVMGPFKILQINFPADGQDQYYILTPTGYLINTLVDPRKLNQALKNEFKDSNFLILNTREPQYQVNANGSHTFTSILRIADTCLACKTIGMATIKFNFNKANRLENIKLEKFEKNN